MTRWASVLNEEECVKKIVNKDYWEAIEKSKEKLVGNVYLFIALVTGCGLITILLILAIYIKRKTESNKESGSGIIESENLNDGD